ncbi:hypothetical protein [Romboutsia sp.]|uniref:hypothetical protein n=1 Tax=Romboutsia sp. TaxID=1965302 RepID=UPI003F40A8D5
MMNVLTTGKHFKEKLNDTKLRNIIKKCTRISPDDRYDNVNKLKLDLESLNNTKAIKAIVTENSPQIILPGFRSGNPLNIILATLFYLALVTGLFAFTSITSLVSVKKLTPNIYNLKLV